VRFIAASPDIQPRADDDDVDEMANIHRDDDNAEEIEEASLSAAGYASLSQLDSTLRVVVISVWIFVDVLLLVRRLSLTVVAARSVLDQAAPPPRYDVTVTSRAGGGCVTWSPAVDQSRQPLAAARQNGGPYCDDVIAAAAAGSRDLRSPEVVRILGDGSLAYVALVVGGACLLAAALCACAAVLDHFLSAVARGSYLLPVSECFRSAVEFLVGESQHLSAAGEAAADQNYELTSLQHIIAVFSEGLTRPAHCAFQYLTTTNYYYCTGLAAFSPGQPG